MCELGSSLINYQHGGGYQLWEECRVNCKNVCRDHKIAVMCRFVDGLIERSERQRKLGHQYDQSGKVTYYTRCSNLEGAEERMREFKASLKVDDEGHLSGGTENMPYAGWLTAIYWQ